MTERLKLMCVFAHPDDETLGTGGILAKYAAEGIDTHLVCATRGEKGWFGAEEDYPGPQALGRLREAELYAAAQTLGLQSVTFLDYIDGELDSVSFPEAIAKITAELRRIRPQVVITFDPAGAYGHPDHIAISQMAASALIAAADPSYDTLTDDAPHRVDKLYYLVTTNEEAELYQMAFGDLIMPVDDVDRTMVTWPDWSITTWVDIPNEQRQRVWQAVHCHQTQLPANGLLEALPAGERQRLWQTQTLYRAHSFVNGGREPEHDLFAGLR